MGYTIKEIFENLERLYPDKKITNLIRHKTLYRQLFKLSKTQNYSSLEKYLNSLGYIYITKKQTYQLKDILKDLEKNYPNKKIKSLHKNKRLYNNLDKIAKNNNCSLEDYLKNLDYEYITYFNKDRDLKTIQYAINNYKVTSGYFAKLLNISKQRVSSLIQKEFNDDQDQFWVTNSFDEEELNLIDKCLSNDILNYTDEKYNLLIAENKNNKYDFMIFLKKDNSIKCMFELTKEVLSIFNKYEYNKFNNYDRKIILELKKYILEKDITDNLYFTDIIKLSNSTKKSLSNICKKHNMTKEEYLNYLGFKEFDSRKNQSENRIKKILQKYLTNDGYVKMPVTAKEYASISSYRVNNNFKALKDMIEYFGFKYERFKSEKNEYEELNNYIVEDKKIYLDSESKLYKRIIATSKKRNFKSIDDFLNHLGYERIKNKKDLPKDFPTFDWKTEQLKVYPHLYSNNKIIEKIELFYGKEKTIKLASNSKIYSDLRSIALVRKEDLYEMLSNLGYKIDKKKIIKKSNNLKPFNNQKNFIGFKLARLKELDKEIVISNLKLNKIKRNQKLVKLLKELYKNECQLCDSSKKELYIPPIYKMDGSIYSEVHHINNLSDTQEEQSLDTYENAIVVCPYHHKVLHFENGGYKEIIKNNNIFYFKSEYGNLLKIHKNYHLKEGLFKTIKKH